MHAAESHAYIKTCQCSSHLLESKSRREGEGQGEAGLLADLLLINRSATTHKKLYKGYPLIQLLLWLVSLLTPWPTAGLFRVKPAFTIAYKYYPIYFVWGRSHDDAKLLAVKLQLRE